MAHARLRARSCECKREEEEARNAKWHRWERAGNMCARRAHAAARAASCFAMRRLTWRAAPLRRRTATRSLRFPDSADMSKVDAKLDNGVLCIWCALQIGPVSVAQAFALGAPSYSFVFDAWLRRGC